MKVSTKKGVRIFSVFFYDAVATVTYIVVVVIIKILLGVDDNDETILTACKKK